MSEGAGKRFRAEVLASGESTWATNGLRFDTRDEALDYAVDLSGRWMAVQKWRAVDESTPFREVYQDGSADGGW